MPTIIGTKDGTRPYLELDWSIKSQDIANNRSTVNLKLYLRVTHRIGYNARYTGVLQGTSFTANAGYLSSPGRYLIAQRNITIGHNSDGTKTQNFSASYNIAISWGGTYYSSISLSGSGTLTPIPRGSTLSAFSFSNSLQVGTANTISYTIARHSDNYRHQFQLRDGSVTIATWDNVNSDGSTVLTLTGAQVNTILGRMSTVTSKTFTLRVATRSGVSGGWIGNAVTRTATASVNANVTPTISSTSAVPIGNSWAVGKGFFVQGQTGVQAQFYGSASGGAWVKSRSISIGNLSSGGAMVGDVFRHSQSRVNSTGNITITYTITDTRNRSVSSTRTVNFRAYTPPQITSFTVGRSSPTSSTVSIKSQGSIHGIGGQNTGTMTVTQQGVTGNVRSISLTNASPSFNDSFTRTVATASSADFTITVTDSLGNRATSTSTVGTAFMELSIRKGTGVGIGKVHERGVLDVDGDAYFKGKIIADRTVSYYSPYDDEISSFDDITTEWSLVSGALHNNPMSIQDDLGNSGRFVYVNTVHYTGGYKKQMAYGYTSAQTWSRYQYNGVWSRWVEDGGLSGSNNNGRWYRMADGLQICVIYVIPDRRSSAQFTVPYPKQFTGDVVLAGSPRMGTEADYNRSNNSLLLSTHITSETSQFTYQFLTTTSTGYDWFIRVVAIGRWK